MAVELRGRRAEAVEPAMDLGAVWAVAGGLLAQQDDQQLLLGEDFLPWMVLALGAALVIGPLFALVRPPADRDPDVTAPVGRTIAMVVVGAIAAIWGLASLLS